VHKVLGGDNLNGYVEAPAPSNSTARAAEVAMERQSGGAERRPKQFARLFIYDALKRACEPSSCLAKQRWSSPI